MSRNQNIRVFSNVVEIEEYENGREMLKLTSTTTGLDGTKLEFSQVMPIMSQEQMKRLWIRVFELSRDQLADMIGLNKKTEPVKFELEEVEPTTDI